MTVAARSARADDAAALAGIRRSAIVELAVPALSEAQAAQWADGAAADRIARAIGEHEVWIAEAGEAVGWVEIDRDRIAALYVRPDHSRRGVGTGLLRLAESRIRCAGHTVAHLAASVNAIGFYARRGYVRSGPTAADGSIPLSKALAGPADALTPRPAASTAAPR